MNDRIDITWEVSDGFVGGARRHSFRLNISDYEGMSLKEIKQSLDKEVQEDFEQKVSWVCDVSEYADEILKALEASPEEEE